MSCVYAKISLNCALPLLDLCYNQPSCALTVFCLVQLIKVTLVSNFRQAGGGCMDGLWNP